MKGLQGVVDEKPAPVDAVEVELPDPDSAEHGMLEQYKQFYTSKVTELTQDRRLKAHLGNRRSTVVGAVSTAWTLHKVELFKVQVDKLMLLAEEYLPTGDIEGLLKSVVKNFERVQELHTTLTVLFSEIEIAAANKRSTKTIQDRIAVELVALRKAQQTLKKSLDRKFKVIDIIRLSQNMEESSVALEEISQEDVDTMI